MFDIQLGNSPAENVISMALDQQFAALFGNDKTKFLKFVTSFRQYMYQNPDLTKIFDTQKGKIALVMAVREAAEADLCIDKKQGAIVIFNQKQKDQFGKDVLVNGKEQWENIPKFFPMVYGIRKLALERAGILLHGDIVHEHDYFDYESGDNGHLVHKPLIFGERGEPVGAYVIAKKGNEILWRTILSKADIEKVRSKSKTYQKAEKDKKTDTTIWVEWWKQMWIKTCIHRLKNEFPLIEGLDKILSNESYDYDDSQIIDIPMQQQVFQPKSLELPPSNEDTKVPNQPITEQKEFAGVSQNEKVNQESKQLNTQSDDGWGEFKQV